jgi:hypothetical protein
MVIGFKADSGVVDGGYAWLIWHVRMVYGWLSESLCMHGSAFIQGVSSVSSYRTVELQQKLLPRDLVFCSLTLALLCCLQESPLLVEKLRKVAFVHCTRPGDGSADRK